MTGNLLVISGPSGVGKDTLMARILDRVDNLVSSVSVTTRKPRSGEKDGIHYYFLDNDVVKSMIDKDELLEWNEYSGNIYGTPKNFIDTELKQGKNIILSIDVNGAENVKKAFPNARLIFIEPPSIDELVKRLKKRGTETDDQIKGRLDIVQSELDKEEMFDMVFVNDDLDDTVDSLVNYIKKII